MLDTAPVLSFLSLLVCPASPEPGVESPIEVQVPFACGQTFPVSQAHFTGSHRNNDGWAWDFRMPEGTPIVAARDGVVRLARADSRSGGCDPKFAADANYVVVAHENDLESQYLHFSQVLVRVGDRVKAGDVLGLAGVTGWACSSHLHFKVARTEGEGWNNPSVPARIAGYGDPGADVLISSSPCGSGRIEVKRPAPDGGTQLPKITATIVG